MRGFVSSTLLAGCALGTGVCWDREKAAATTQNAAVARKTEKPLYRSLSIKRLNQVVLFRSLDCCSRLWTIEEEGGRGSGD